MGKQRVTVWCSVPLWGHTEDSVPMLLLLDPASSVAQILESVSARAATTPQLGPEFRYVQMRLGAKDGPIIDTDTTLEELDLVPSDRVFALGLCETVKTPLVVIKLPAVTASHVPEVPEQHMAVRKVHAHLRRTRVQRTEMQWNMLPHGVVQRIAIHLSSPTSLAWCATCRNFREAQPPLRMLCISANREDYLPSWTRQPELQEDLRINFCNVDANGPPYAIFARLSDRYAKELTHVYIDAYHRDGVRTNLRPEVPRRCLGAGLESLPLSGLKVLHIRHGVAGSWGRWSASALMPAGGIDDDEEHPSSISLTRCAAQLVSSSAHNDSLRTLSIDAVVCFDLANFLEIIPSRGPGLHYLSMNLTPWRAITLQHIPMSPADYAETVRLVTAVEEHCSSLKAPAAVTCHNDVSCWGCKDSWFL